MPEDEVAVVAEPLGEPGKKMVWRARAKPPGAGPMTRMPVFLDTTTWHEVRTLAARRGLTMRALLVGIMRSVVYEAKRSGELPGGPRAYADALRAIGARVPS